MPQAERMANFVSCDFHHKIMDEFLGIRSLRVHAPGNQQIKGELRVQNSPLREVAKVARPVVPGGEERLLRPVHPGHSRRRNVFTYFPVAEARHARIKSYIRVVNLSRQWVHARRTL